jgi:hypothetical protein
MGQGCISLGRGSGTTGAAGMFVSEDAGENWKQISAYPTVEGVRTLAQTDVYQLVGDPNDPEALYWLSRADGLFYSYDSGRSWHSPAGPLARGFIYALSVHPKDRCTIMATNGSEVYMSTDCTRSWKEVYRETRTDARVNGLEYNPFEPHQVFMTISSGDLLESSDSGASWRVVHRFFRQVAQVDVDPRERGVIYVASRKDGLYRSRDAGLTWDELEKNIKAFPNADEYRRFVLHPTAPGTLYWISTYGILISDDSGDTWAPMDLITPPGSAQIYGFAINPNNTNEIYYTATINSRSTLYKTADGGGRWVTERLPSGQLPSVLRVHPAKGNILYIGFTIPPRERGPVGQIPVIGQ